MGRATIVEHLGEAKYKIQVHRDSPRVRAIIDMWLAEADSIDEQCAELEPENAELEAATLEAQSRYEQAQVAYEQAGADQPASESWTEVNNLLGEYLSALTEWEAVANKLFGLQAHARHLRNKASNMEAELAPRETEAWCSTYTTDLAPGTEVATIEVARQGDDFPYHVIAPDGRAPEPDDGQMRSVMSMTPAQAYLNYALWPGAVRWRPRYSSGVVTEEDDGRGAVEVLPDTSFAGGVMVQADDVFAHDIPTSPNFWGISPFEIGDNVLVLNSEEPDKVIGWCDHPRPVLVPSGIFPRYFKFANNVTWADGDSFVIRYAHRHTEEYSLSSDEEIPNNSYFTKNGRTALPFREVQPSASYVVGDTRFVDYLRGLYFGESADDQRGFCYYDDPLDDSVRGVCPATFSASSNGTAIVQLIAETLSVNPVFKFLGTNYFVVKPEYPLAFGTEEDSSQNFTISLNGETVVQESGEGNGFAREFRLSDIFSSVENGSVTILRVHWSCSSDFRIYDSILSTGTLIDEFSKTTSGTITFPVYKRDQFRFF